MIIEETSGYKNSKKKIKNNHESLDIHDKVRSHIYAAKNRDDLINNPISRLYGYEELKNDLSGYHRFSLCKNASHGKFRLVFSFIDDDTIRLEYVSDEHYMDFKRYLRKAGVKNVAC